MAVGLTGVLVIAAVVYGVGVASAKYRIADVGAWLAAGSRGLVVHVNGPAAKVDGKTGVPPQMRGHDIKIIQDGATVLIVDQATGVVSRSTPPSWTSARAARSAAASRSSRAPGGPTRSTPSRASSSRSTRSP
ncbi:hypothetical protein ACFQY7_21355 [Actinomadura luteofluorescens]|uniref:hypothetical protein n=1 Tax=Actinomadura luteofluorescens TaxID=46163 RepID=UPI0036446CCC